MEVRIEITGPPGAGKSLMARAFIMFMQVMPGLTFSYKVEQTTANGIGDVIVADLSVEDRNMLADFIQMREQTRRN